MAIRKSSKLIVPSTAMGATFTGRGVNIEDYKNWSIQFVCAGGGSPVGAFTVQYSNDAGTQPSLDDTGTTNWTADGVISVSVSGDGSYYVEKANNCAKWVRVVYTRTSGSNASACTATIFMKE